MTNKPRPETSHQNPGLTNTSGVHVILVSAIPVSTKQNEAQVCICRVQ